MINTVNGRIRSIGLLLSSSIEYVLKVSVSTVAIMNDENSLWPLSDTLG